MNASSSSPQTALSVNLNKVALIRNSRHLGIPSLTVAVDEVLSAGASGITLHPRPDARHIRGPDVRGIALLLRERWPRAELNLEGNPFHNLMEFVREVRPSQVTFVPDSEGQFTSDHGWALVDMADRLIPLIRECHDLGCRVSLFMDPVAEDMPAVRETGADRVELYTEAYARAFAPGAEHSAVKSYASAARAALDAGLAVNAGHDLSLDNLSWFIEKVPAVSEVSIGHALISDALVLGYRGAVQRYLACLRETGSYKPV